MLIRQRQNSKRRIIDGEDHKRGTQPAKQSIIGFAPKAKEECADSRTCHGHHTIKKARHGAYSVSQTSANSSTALATHAVAARAIANAGVPSTTKSARTSALLTAKPANDRLLQRTSRVA